MRYLTPAQYRLADDGLVSVSSSVYSDALLARFIARAESSIDTYIGFDLRLGGFEPGTRWYQTAWDWGTRKTHLPGWPVPIRTIDQYRIQISMDGTTGEPFFATITQPNIAINSFDQYLEIVPLSTIVYSLMPPLSTFGLRPPLVIVDYESGYYLGATGDVLYDSGDGLTFQALRGFWATSYRQQLAIQPQALPAVPAKVYVNGVLKATPTDYTLNAQEGSVTFVSSQKGNAISADYCYQIPDAVRDATISQTTWLLAQRSLNQQNLTAVDQARTGDTSVRITPRAEAAAKPAGLCHDAISRLQEYKRIGIAAG